MEKTFEDMDYDVALILAQNNPIEWVKTAMRSLGLERFCPWELEGTTHHGLLIYEVNSVGGHEGEGEYVERTYAVKNDTQTFFYFECQGRYNSWDGTEWDDDFYLVKPVQVMVTQYHAI